MAIVPMNDAFEIAAGLNPITGKVHRSAIDCDEIYEGGKEGQETILTLEVISSSQQLSEKLSLDAAATMKGFAWNASLSCKMMRVREINQYSTYALVRVEVRNPPQKLKDKKPRLTQEAEEVLKTEGWDAFVCLYGSEYIVGFQTGGLYYAMIEIQTKSEKQQQSMKAKLQGAYGKGFFKASGSAEVAAELTTASEQSSINITVMQTGGLGDDLEIDLQTMIKQAIEFPKRVEKNPVRIAALTSAYKDTIKLPTAATIKLTSTQQKDIIDDLSRLYLKLRDYKSSLDFVLANFIEFDDFRDLSAEQIEKEKAKFQKSLKDTVEELQMIVKEAKQCAEDATRCEPYVQKTEILKLPTIGGKLMSLKQLEEKVAKLEQQVNAAKFSNVEANEVVSYTLRSPGRTHITGEEFCYMLHKMGVIIGKEWGGTGNLLVEGDLTVIGTINGKKFP